MSVLARLGRTSERAGRGHLSAPEIAMRRN